MTKEEQKAIELVKKYYPYLNNYSTISKPDEPYEVIVEEGQRLGRAKQCATLECQSIIDELKLMQECLSDSPSHAKVYHTVEKRIEHYKGVIKAIEQQ